MEENFAQHGTFSMENSSVREKCNYCNSANHLVIVYYRPSRWRIFTYLISAEEIATNRTNFHLRLRIQNVIALLFVFVIGQKLFRKSASIQRGCLFNIEFRPNKSKLKIFFDESFFFFYCKELFVDNNNQRGTCTARRIYSSENNFRVRGINAKFRKVRAWIRRSEVVAGPDLILFAVEDLGRQCNFGGDIRDLEMDDMWRV